MTSPPLSGNPREDVIPPLKQSDRLTRDEFERRFDAMPNLKEAELIEGVVHISGPVPLRSHAKPRAHLIGWLGIYGAFTPGVEGGAHGHIRLDMDNEPQPAALLLIDPACGGQARISDDDYVERAPELVAEVAASSASYDLHTKLNVYRRNGVREYLVWRVHDEQFDWFVLRSGQFEPLKPDAAGILKSDVFPGLWLDAAALLRGDMPRVLAVVQQGTARPEYADFVGRLQANRGQR